MRGAGLALGLECRLEQPAFSRLDCIFSHAPRAIEYSRPWLVVILDSCNKVCEVSSLLGVFECCPFALLLQ